MYVHVGVIVLVRCSSTQCCVSLQRSEYSQLPSPSPSVLFHVFYLFSLPPLSLSSIFQQFTVCLSRTAAALDVHNMGLTCACCCAFYFLSAIAAVHACRHVPGARKPVAVHSKSSTLRVSAHVTTLWVCALLPPHACVSL